MASIPRTVERRQIALRGERMSGITCVVTIHGIGFQEPPRPPHDGYAETPGYADGLQTNLAEQLPELSDDPDRQSWQTAKSLPVYVCSHFQGSRALGLKRLGEWEGELGGGKDGPPH